MIFVPSAPGRSAPCLRFTAALTLLLAGCGSGETGPVPVGEESSSTQNDAKSGTGSEPQVVLVSCKDDADCDTGDLCQGKGTCEGGTCDFADAVNCNDQITCTIDSCDSKTGECSHRAPDRDGDGSADAACKDAKGESLGTDCDDEDAGRFPENAEVCTLQFIGSNVQGIGDGKDEDCDTSTFGSRDRDDDGYVDSECYNTDEKGKRIQGGDCNDRAPGVHPTATETCDYFDNNCNGEIDEGVSFVRYDDPDGDGYGGTQDPDDPSKVILVETTVCAGAVRVAENETDCGPHDRFISPDRNELCDGVDNNCNGEIDEMVSPSLWFKDADRDGYGDPSKGTRSTCERIDHEGWALFAGDCDDSNPLVNPAQAELCDGLDNDCNPDTTYLIAPGNTEDDDGDGVPDAACGGLVLDCLDTDPTVYPGAKELCDGVDNNCNGFVDTQTSLVQWYVDADGDGFGDAAAGGIESCEPVAGRITRGGDCDDADIAIHPEAADSCEGQHGVDDDCDGEIDEGEALTAYYNDSDGDGFGSEILGYACEVPLGFVGRGGDCQEDDGAIHPDATEICASTDGVDQDCDQKVDCRDEQCIETDECKNLYGIELVDPSTSTLFVSDTVDLKVRVTIPPEGGLGEPTPVPNSELIITADDGCLVPTDVVTTDNQGYATFTVGVGMKEKTYNFTIQNGTTLPRVVSLNAILPPRGTVWTVMGDRSKAHKPGEFGPKASASLPSDIALRADGSAYLASTTRIYHLDALGRLSLVAGTGTRTDTGNGGPAADATFSDASQLAIHEGLNRLFVRSKNKVRVIDLNTPNRVVYHYGGGGSEVVPAFGEISSVLIGDANLGQVNTLDVLPSGQLIVGAANGYFSVDPETDVISRVAPVADVASNGPTPRAGGQVHYSARGNLWIGARFYGQGMDTRGNAPGWGDLGAAVFSGGLPSELAVGNGRGEFSLGSPAVLEPRLGVAGHNLVLANVYRDGNPYLTGLNSIALSWDQFLRGTEPHNFLASMDGRRTLGR